jgi:glycosyltransferase involved in cell wall biosynthesis
MRVCFVLNDFNRGGAERLVKDLLVQLGTYEGIDPFLIVVNENGEMRSEFVTSGIETVSLGMDISMATVPKGIASLASELRNRNVDVVHSHLSFSHLISRVACAGLSVPHVATYHNVYDKRTPMKRVAERTSRRLSDRVVCVSDGVRRSYPNSERMDVIYNAIDVEGFNRRISMADSSELMDDAGEADTIYLNVARCVDVKRQQDLVEAVSDMDADDVHLFIVGDGPRRPMLEELVAEKGLSDRVSLPGYVESIDPYYAVSDVFVSSSSKEGLPTTHIEAMAAKLPIVSTDIPGVTEIVEHGKNGYLCPVGRPDELSNAMRWFHENDSRSFSENGYETARSRFSIENVTEEHIDLYRELL